VTTKKLMFGIVSSGVQHPAFFRNHFEYRSDVRLAECGGCAGAGGSPILHGH